MEKVSIILFVSCVMTGRSTTAELKIDKYVNRPDNLNTAVSEIQ